MVLYIVTNYKILNADLNAVVMADEIQLYHHRSKLYFKIY